jgi:hypothetical protein
MPKKGPPEQLRVEIITLKSIYAPIHSYLFKIESLLQDHYKSHFIFNQSSIMTLMELKISCEIATSYLEDLFEQAEEASTKEVYLDTAEIRMITNIATSINTATTLTFENTNLLEN